METNIGKLTATLIEADVDKIQGLIDKINANIKPATKLSPDDVHIRCMYIVSEELNSYGGKFPLVELYKIKELIVDSPVLIGHKKDQLPIGRNFHAEVLQKEDSHWVKSYFYWMKSADNSEDLLKNIDGGIIKECSIGFTFLMPECSICESDIRSCRHEPFRDYTINGISQSCFFYYKEIDRVLETSLVYRGAIPNTSISNDLYNSESDTENQTVEKLTSLDCLNEHANYLITPNYIGLDVRLTTSQNTIELRTIDGAQIPTHLLKKYFREYPKNLKNHVAQLIGYRGKERCSLDELQKFINNEISLVKRLELRLLPSLSVLKMSSKNIKAMRYKIVRKEEIQNASQAIMTKDGVRLWSLSTIPNSHAGSLYNPVGETKERLQYQISYDAQREMVLTIIASDQTVHYKIKRFNKELLHAGKRFLAEKIEKQPTLSENNKKRNSGEVLLYASSQDVTELKLQGLISEHLIIKPIMLNEKIKYQLYALG